MKANAYIFSLVLLTASKLGMAVEAADVKAMYLQPDGSVSGQNMNNLDKIRWLRGSIAAAKERLAKELPVTGEPVEIALISVPHPSSSLKANSMFVEWKHEKSAVSFVPLVRAAGTEKLDVLLAFEVRVSMPGKEPRVYPVAVADQKEFTAGFLSVGNRYDALESIVTQLFDNAISRVIADSRGATPPEPSVPAREPALEPQPKEHKVQPQS